MKSELYTKIWNESGTSRKFHREPILWGGHIPPHYGTQLRQIVPHQVVEYVRPSGAVRAIQQPRMIPSFIVPMHVGRTVRNLPEAIRRTVAVADCVSPSGCISRHAKPIQSDRYESGCRLANSDNPMVAQPTPPNGTLSPPPSSSSFRFNRNQHRLNWIGFQEAFSGFAKLARLRLRNSAKAIAPHRLAAFPG